MLGYFELYPSSVQTYIFGYNDTGYRDTPLTVTLFSCPEGVNETEYVLNRIELT